MPGLEQLAGLSKTYGFSVAFLLCCILGLIYALRAERAEKQQMHAKLIELLDQRGRFLDSILQEAINGNHSKRNS